MLQDPLLIVVLGGSYAGISTAHYLLKHVVPNLPSDPPHRVILISASAQAMCRPACPRAMISDDMLPQDKLFVDVPPLFEQYSSDVFEFVHGTATALDCNQRTVWVQPPQGEIQMIVFNALVIATGASTASPLLGLNQNADVLRASWTKFREALTHAKSIVIAGSGPAGIETAGELGEYLNGRAGFFSSKLNNPRVAITVVAGKTILPALRPEIAEKAVASLAKVGVEVLRGVRVACVESREVKAPENEQKNVSANAVEAAARAEDTPSLERNATAAENDAPFAKLQENKLHFETDDTKATVDGISGRIAEHSQSPNMSAVTNEGRIGMDLDNLTSKATITLDDGRALEADIYIPAMGTIPNTSFIADRRLLEEDGRVRTNRQTLRVDDAGSRVYAVGDVASCYRSAIHLTLDAIPILCANVKRDLLLECGVDDEAAGGDREYAEDTRETQLVPIGNKGGVGAAMGYQVPGFLVWAIKGRDYWLWTLGRLWSGKRWSKPS